MGKSGITQKKTREHGGDHQHTQDDREILYSSLSSRVHCKVSNSAQSAVVVIAAVVVVVVVVVEVVVVVAVVVITPFNAASLR